MSQMDQDNATPAREPVDRDLLISRVVDDAASAGDWAQLRALAEYDPSVWRELFEAQHAQAELAQAVQQAIAIADGIEAPVESLPGHGLRFRARQVAGWAGWAVAASVAVVWMAPHMMTTAAPPIAPSEPVASNSTAAETSARDLATRMTESTPAERPSERQFESFGSFPPRGLASRDPVISDMPQYESRFASQPYRMVSDLSGTQSSAGRPSAGQPLAEMPDRVLLEVRPLPNGQLELIYVRRLIEKAVVDENDLYQVKPDDAGIDRTVPYRTRKPSSGPI